MTQIVCDNCGSAVDVKPNSIKNGYSRILTIDLCKKCGDVFAAIIVQFARREFRVRRPGEF